MATTKTKIGNLFFNFRGIGRVQKLISKMMWLCTTILIISALRIQIPQMMFLKRTNEDM